MPIIPPIVFTTIVASVASLIPKAVSDAYDYFFNGEEIQVKKVADRSKLDDNQIAIAKGHYLKYLAEDSTFTSQKELTHFLNTLFSMNKSVAQMMRICRGT